MRKVMTLIGLGAVAWALAGCEQGTMEPADEFPENDAPLTEPDVQIGQGDPVEPGEPAGIEQESEFEPNVETIEPNVETVEPDANFGDEPDAEFGGSNEVEPQN